MARAKRQPPPPVIDEDAIARRVLDKFKHIKDLYGGKFTREDWVEMIGQLTPEQRESLTAMWPNLEAAVKKEQCRLDFAEFVKVINPDDLPGKHFDVLTNAFNRIAEGESVRLIINIAPRRGKSQRASYLFPAWFIGRFPKKKILTITNVRSLAADFGSQVRNLMETPEYQQIFPNVKLSKDAQAKDKWRTNHKGEYFAAGAGSTIYGRGADLCVHPDSIVISERGKIKASEVVLGDRLLGKGDSGWEFGDVTHRIETHSDTEISINGRVRCTPSHPIWVKDRGWVKAIEVRPGDVVLSPFLLRIKWLLCSMIEKWNKY